MALSEKAEEVLEVLWSQQEEHDDPESDATLLKDDQSLRSLASHGLVTQDGRRIRLTKDGVREAAGCVRRHRLAERLLVDVLHVKGALVHDTGCSFEHLLHKGIDDSICTLLGHPRTCPHGRRIPEGPCCREARKQTGKVIMPLTELEPKRKAVIAYLRTHDREALQKLMAMGALPQAEVVVLQRFPTLVFQMGKSQFAVDEALASHIYVRRN
jgi:DtxR family transcriptional regulator, Mn-dependent transcriptional regulator